MHHQSASKQVTHMLKEIEQTHSKIMSNTEAYWIQHSNFGKFVFHPSFQIARLAQTDREFGRAVDQVVNTVIKIPAVLPLATLLDSHRGGNHIGDVNQPAMDDSVKKKPKKKKKKRLRM
jgi:hypothetical protein